MKTILIIEDDELIRSIVHKFLLLQNFNVLVAEDGWLGLQLATDLEPDLIISDINLPEIDGYKLLYLLRANFNTTNIPFIFLTANANPECRSYAFQLGANDYLTKPFQFGNLLKAIETQLQNTQLTLSSSLSDASNSNWLSHRYYSYDHLDPENGGVVANMQKFAQQMHYICDLEITGKLSPEAAYKQIRTLWQQLEV